jgi:hypothetical protein
MNSMGDCVVPADEYSCAHGAQTNFVDLLVNSIFNLLNKK